ncbi:MAG: protein translocase subunit SecF [Oscillospiraceae bacterium]|nr:protein translocase subunit SecF [Oscillospiraceae bacterium]
MRSGFDFYKYRKTYIIIAAVILIGGLVGGMINGGLNFDIQFEGGTLIEIPMSEDNFETADVESLIFSYAGKQVVAQKQSMLGQEDAQGGSVTLLLKASKSETLSEEQVSQVIEMIKDTYGIMENRNISIQTVAPYIGTEMLQKGLLAVSIAMGLILLYVWWRFSVVSGLSAAIFATLGLFFTASVMLAAYAVFRIPINESFIAAVLTIMGYTINVTVIVYDRMRENIRKFKKLSYEEFVNRSLNQTTKRSIITSITTMICVVIVFVFAVIFNISSLRYFCLPLMIGLTAGLYSTYLITVPLWGMWQIHKQNRTVSPRKA